MWICTRLITSVFYWYMNRQLLYLYLIKDHLKITVEAKRNLPCPPLWIWISYVQRAALLRIIYLYLWVLWEEFKSCVNFGCLCRFCGVRVEGRKREKLQGGVKMRATGSAQRNILCVCTVGRSRSSESCPVSVSVWVWMNMKGCMYKWEWEGGWKYACLFTSLFYKH